MPPISVGARGRQPIADSQYFSFCRGMRCFGFWPGMLLSRWLLFAMASLQADKRYSRDDLLRLLGIKEQKLRQWEKQDLVPQTVDYLFSDLLAMRTILRLAEAGHSPSSIKRIVAALRQKLSDYADPLTQLRIISDQRKVQVVLGKQKMEALSGQLLLNFDAEEIRTLLAFPAEAQKKKDEERRKAESLNLFEQGVRAEQGGQMQDALALYEKALELDPRPVAAVNIGTIYFNARRFRDAERFYKKAVDANPQYALAHFNLGNLFDERRDYPRAQVHYQTAIAINARYADAHYNLALLYQPIGQPMNAVKHWKEFLKLDPNSNWSEIARRELAKLREQALIGGGRRNA